MQAVLSSRLIVGWLMVLLTAAAGGADAGTQRFTGELTRQDRQLDGGEYADYIRVELKAGQLLTVSLRSTAFNTWLQATAPDESHVKNDDRDDNDTNSQLQFMVPQDGTWVIWISSARPGETGAYELTVTTLDTKLTSAVQGELGEGDQFSLKTGEWCDPYTLQLQPGQVLVVRLMSQDFDTFLTAYEADRRLFSDDDYDRTQSVVVLTGGEEGRAVTLVVTAYDETGKGRYTLEYREMVDEPTER